MTSQLSTQPYKGTRDFYPTDMRVRTWMFDRLRSTLTNCGYEEYDGPMLEPFELYAAKTSEEIVNEQLYWLVDRGERKLAIRPEMTPTLARMVAGKQNDLPRPIRWFSIPNLWRYERPQRGRLREHWQLNVDVFGGDVMAEDIEILHIVTALMNGFGATPDRKLYEVRVNHRGLTDVIFKKLMQLQDGQIPAIGKLLDAAPKMKREVLTEAFMKEGLSATQQNVFLSLLKPDAAETLRPALEGETSYGHLMKILAALKDLGIAPAFRYDPAIMRGFMYYTGLVFEVFDLHPENNRALFGGGRYDNLVGMFGNKALPGVGFGMGDVTLRNFLETNGLLPTLDAPSGVYICALEESLLTTVQKIAYLLRKNLTGKNAPVRPALSAEKPKKAFTTAERLKARAVIFVGSDDVAKGVFPMKDLVSGTQHSGTPEELAKILAGFSA